MVIVGGIEQETTLSLVNETFSEFSVRSECPTVVIESEPPAIAISRLELYLPRIEQARLFMAWVCPGSANLTEAIALDLIGLILSRGRSSGLVRELREERQLVLDIDSDISLQKDSSLFTINVWLETEHLAKVETIIGDRLFQLQSTEIPETAIARAKRQLINNYIFSTETPSQLAGLYGFYQTVATAQQSSLYPQIVNQLPADQLQAIASRYLSPERYAVTVLKPRQ